MNVDTVRLMKVAEMVLDDEGQVEVSVRIDDGEIRRAQVCLIGAIDRLLQEEQDGHAELAALIPQIGLSPAEVEQIRSLCSNPANWK